MRWSWRLPIARAANQIHANQADEGTGRYWRYDSASNFIRDAKIALERLLYPG